MEGLLRYDRDKGIRYDKRQQDIIRDYYSE